MSSTAQIVFRTVVQQAFSDTYPSGDASVDQGDVLTNTVDIDGAVLDVADAEAAKKKLEEAGAKAALK